MPSIDPGSKHEHDCLDKENKDIQTTVKMPAENREGEGKAMKADVIANGNEPTASKMKENGHTIIMEARSTKTVNAHLVKNDVICLKKSPVKPVMIKGTVKVEKAECSKDLSLQNGSLKTPVESSENSENKAGERTPESCGYKKPLSFKLLRREISKEQVPSRWGKLASRQRHTSESLSYKKQTHKMIHSNSDPTNLYSETVFEDEKHVKSEDTGVKKTGEAQVSESTETQSDVDRLADDLGSALKIASKSENKDELVKNKSEKEISELADGLQTSLHIKNQDTETIIVVKKTDVRISSCEKIIIKEEPEKEEIKVIKIKQEPKDEETELGKKVEDGADQRDKDAAGKKGEDAVGRFIIERIEDNKSQLRSKGIQNDQIVQMQMPQHQSLQGFFGYQQPLRYQQSVSDVTKMIPSFQKTFVQGSVPLHHPVLTQGSHIQSVQPPQYIESHQQHQQQIIVPPSISQHNQPIVVPPSNTNFNSHQMVVNSSIFQSHQNQFGGMPMYGSYTTPLQQSGMSTLPGSRRQPEENVWPGPDDLSDTTSLSPYNAEDMDQISSPQSVASDFNTVTCNSPLDSQGLPSPHPSSPSAYPTVPTLSPETPLVYSPSASPGSPNSHTIKTTGSNIGVVTINEPQQSGTKRQRLSESETQQQNINQIIDYLKQGSPESLTDNNPVSPESVESVTPPPPTPMTPQQYQIQSQPSPPPGKIAVQTHQPQQPRYPYQQPDYTGMVAVQPNYYPSTQLSQPRIDAVLPNQVANQQDYELQEWRQRVAKLSPAQLKEQDDDKDTVLHLAVIQEEKYLMMAIVEKIGRDGINMKNKQSQTPLYLAAVTNQPEFVYYLIQNGADATIPAEQAGNTPLHYAAQQGFVGVIEAIMAGLAQTSIPDKFIDCKNFDGKSALHCAVEAHEQPFMDTLGNMGTIDSMQTVDILMKYGASALYQDGKSGKTAMHYAIERHQIDIARLLLERSDNAGELVNCQMYNGNTALHLIVGRQDIPKAQILEVVWLLMSRGANVSIENAEKDTPGKLVQIGHEEVKKMLSGQAHGGR